MTLMVGKRRVIQDANLIASSVAETDALDSPLWSSGTSYVIGNRVRRSTTNFHKTFECIRAHTNKDPLTAANVGPTADWVLVAWTHRWRVFDDNASLQSIPSVTYAYWRIDAPGVDTVTHMSVFNASGDVLRIAMLTAQTTAATNPLNADSENFAGSLWTKTRCSVVGATIQDPLCSVRVASELIEDGTAANTHLLQATSLGNVAFVSGVAQTLSMYAKRGTGTRNVRLRLPVANFPVNTFANFTLAGAGTAATSGGASSASCTSVGDGWYRCVVTATPTVSGTSPFAAIEMLDSGLNGSYNGDGTSRLFIHGINITETATVQSYRMTDDTLDVFIRSVLKTHTFLYNAKRYAGAAPYNPNVIVATGSTGALSSFDQYEISVELTNQVDPAPRIGEIVVIYDTEALGELTEPLDESLLDFSVKTRDDFGNISLIQRNAADDINYTFRTDRANRNRVKSVLKSRRGQPLVFFDDADMDNIKGILSFAFINGYSMPLTSTDAQIVSLDTEGMT